MYILFAYNTPIFFRYALALEQKLMLSFQFCYMGEVFVHRTYLTAVLRHAGLVQLAALLLLSLFLHSASQLPKGLHWPESRYW
jgi:hypothetical protein